MSRFPRQLVLVYGAHGLNGVLGVLAVPLTVRLLGFSGYGLFSFYVLLVSYLLLADFGVGKNLLRLLAESPRPDRRETNTRVALALYLLLGAAWFLLVPLLAIVIPRYIFPVAPESLAVLRWMVLLGILEFALGIPASLMQTTCVAAQRFESYAKFTLLTGLTRNGAILLGAALFGSPAGLAAVMAGRKIIDTVIAGRSLGWLPRAAWVPLFDLGNFRSMLRKSAVLSASQILYATAMSLGSLLVNAAFGLHALGVYRSAYDLAGKIAFVSNGVQLVVFPRAARRFGNAHPDPAWLAAGTRCSAILFACFAAAAVLAAPRILPFIGLGNDTTVSLFLLLVVALSLNAHSLISNELLQAAGRYGASVCFSVSTLATIALVFVAAKPATGIMAIGWAWIGAAVVSACVADGLLLATFGTPTIQQGASAFWKLLATAACVGLAAGHFGLLADACFIAVLLILLGFAVHSAIPLLRRSRQGAAPAWEAA
jgi:O-antigen/teichoic acid export membrane protein